MRMRKKKHGAERIEACSALLIKDPEKLHDNPGAVFENPNLPLCLEIGCGKGDFACGMSAKNSNLNFIAVERVADVCCVALEKAMHKFDGKSTNLKFIIGNADSLNEWFGDCNFDRIYLNFSDPWPKAGHAKRRLTHKNYLEKYKKILKKGGKLFFKTDNEGLFDFSIEEFKNFGLNILWMTKDLHVSERAEDNVMTEYERNFSQKGFKICMAEVQFP